MINAEEFECRVPTLDAVKDAVIYCSATDNNIAEIWSAAGTIGATIVALGFGLMEYRRGRKDRAARIELNSMSIQNEQFQLVLQLMKSVVDEFPAASDRLSNRLIAQIRIYEQLLISDRKTPKPIAESVQLVLTHFASLSIQYSADNNRLADRMGDRWASAVSVPARLLGLIHFRLETALSLWHRTRSGEESAIEEIESLAQEIEAYGSSLAEVNKNLEGDQDA